MEQIYTDVVDRLTMPLTDSLVFTPSLDSSFISCATDATRLAGNEESKIGYDSMLNESMDSVLTRRYSKPVLKQRIVEVDPEVIKARRRNL